MKASLPKRYGNIRVAQLWTSLHVALKETNKRYMGHVEFKTIVQQGNAVSFTLKLDKAGVYGSKVYESNHAAPSQRRSRNACWHLHRDFLAAFFKELPDAKVTTALATYDTAPGFANVFLTTKDHREQCCCPPEIKADDELVERMVTGRMFADLLAPWLTGDKSPTEYGRWTNDGVCIQLEGERSLSVFPGGWLYVHAPTDVTQARGMNYMLTHLGYDHITVNVTLPAFSKEGNGHWSIEDERGTRYLKCTGVFLPPSSRLRAADKSAA